MVRSLALALEARDGYTGEHSDAVERLSVAVAGRLGLDRAGIADVQSTALLHEIGKIGIPDRVLHKPGPLDAEEWALMKEHPAIGERILRPLPGFGAIATAVRHEHERWHGGGYPDGLAGEAIPVASRIVLACDAWNALVSDRPYRRALPEDEARAELRRSAGSQFDRGLIDALLACLDAPDADPVSQVVPALPGREGGDGEDLQRLSRELRALMTVSFDLLRTADTALYSAKRTGRGRVCLADIDPQRVWRSTGRPGARRARRDGLDVDTGALIVQGLALLDGALRSAAPLERLEGLVTTLGSSLRAAAAAVSLCPHGVSYIDTLFTLDLRSGHSSSVRFGVDGERYALEDYPSTGALLARGGSLHLYAADAEADASERALLQEWGMTDVLLAAAADGRGAWLIEIFGDAESADLALADGALRLLCAHAVRPAAGLRTESRRATGAMRAVQ